MSEEALARERDAKFKQWLQNKAIKDKAFEYMAKLSQDRATKEESLIEVGVCLSAVDRLLGGEEMSTPKPGVVGGGSEDKAPGASSGKNEGDGSKKSLKAVWTRWAMEFYSLSMLRLTQRDLTTISDAVKEFLLSESELLIYSDPEEAAKADKEKNILPSLKYFFPAVPKPNEKPRPLTNDQKAQNVIYLRELRKLWKKAEEEMNNRVEEYVARGLKASAELEGESKERAAKTVGRTDLAEDAKRKQSLVKQLESQCLMELSLRRLRDWIEQDEDEKLKDENEKALPGDLETSRTQLLKLGYVAKENFDEGEEALFAREKRENQVIVERQRQEQKQKEDNAKAYDEWIVLKGMRDQALKCLQLLPKPQVAYTGTLRRSGYFGDDIAPSRRSVTSSQGELSTTGRGKGVAPSSSSAPGGTTAQFALNLKDNRDRDTFDRIVEVGKNLKRIDRTLFKDWAQWCGTVVPVNIASVLWDFFAPRACDVHSAAYSQIRDGFLKLLRPGVDYRETFLDFVERTIFSKRVQNIRDEKGYYRMEPEEKMDVDADIEGLRKEWLQDVSIPRPRFKALLATMGIVLKDAEMRSLLDAFDTNGDGVITLKEFLDFCGPKRDKRSGNSLILNQRCCWVTTCPITGMPNGYSVSNATKRLIRQEKERKAKESGESRGGSRYDDPSTGGGADDEENAKMNHGQVTGKMVIKHLANGEQRMCVELADRLKREELLRRFGLLPPNEEAGRKQQADERKQKTRHNRARSPRDDYGDDFESAPEDDPYGDDAFDHHEGDVAGGGADQENSHKKTAPGTCEMSLWSTKDRRVGLQYMMDITKDLREEEALKTLIANGKAPNAPRCWIQFEKKMDVKGKNRFSNDASVTGGGGGGGTGTRTDHELLAREIVAVSEDLGIDGSTEMMIFWGPQATGELVSFYSLEFAGPITIHTKLGDAKYTEIFRDPQEADEDATFAFQYLMTNLTPGTSYLFRIRAFNGFGPSEYTYKTFTTLTNAPMQPRALKVAPESVVLRWTFSASFFQRIEELKRLFAIADRDRSGRVDREELTAILNDRVEDSAPLKVFLDRIVSSKYSKQELGDVQGYAGLFDMIEADDDGYLSWQEFENFFLSTGWANMTATTANNGGGLVSDNMSVTSGATGRGSQALNGGNSNIKPGDIVYVIEKCSSEFDDTYQEVMRTTSGQAMVKGLEPGQSYRFRVYAVNADGLPGPSSPSALVHTLLETPSAPQPRSIQARTLTLTWKTRNYVTNTRTKAFVDNMMNDWTHAHFINDGGVSIDMIFAKYDRNQSGDIDAQELGLVLEDLGVEPTPERISAAFQAIDADHDGTISFEEFAKWWRQQEVTYVLKRSDEIQPQTRQAWSASQPPSVSNSANNSVVFDDGPASSSRPRSGSAMRSSRTGGGGGGGGVVVGSSTNAMPLTARSASRGATATARDAGASGGGSSGKDTGLVYVNPVPYLNASSLPPIPIRAVAVPKVVFREAKTRFECKGLTPNSLYYFKVRYVGPRSNSMLSPPLVIMTAPLAPSIPVLIDVTSNTMRIKWYASEYGSFKFVVHMRVSPTVGGANGGGTKRMPTTTLTGLDLKDEGGWFQVYLGQDNVYTCVTLASETTYEVRVFAMNYQGTLSEPSPSLTLTTLARSDLSSTLTPKNAAQSFTVECTGDICVGDTVLITERLYLRPTQAMAARGVQSIAVTGSIHAIKGITNTGAASSGKVTATAVTNKAATSRRGGAPTQHDITVSSRSGLMEDGQAQQAFDGGVSITSVAGAFLGERTIAALVTKDNYRSSRDAMTARNVSPNSNPKVFGGMRRLWLEVVWQKSSSEEVRKYEAKPGEVIERLQSHLEEFEVFRVPWRQDNLRKSLVQEWQTLKDCFIPMT
eukprot:gene2248-1646_t